MKEIDIESLNKGDIILVRRYNPFYNMDGYIDEKMYHVGEGKLNLINTWNGNPNTPNIDGIWLIGNVNTIERQ
jgi:hypothetical protein